MKIVKKASHKAGCILVALALLSGVLFCGCSLEPDYYSEEEVLKYVYSIYGTGWKFTDKNVYVDETDEDENPVYQYTFTDNKGMSFTVEAYTYHISIDASTTIFYEKGIRDDYFENKLEFNMDNIGKIMNRCGLEWDAGNNYYADIMIFLDDYTQVNKAASAIEKIDSLLDLRCSFEEWKSKEDSLIVQIVLKPLSETEGWKEDYNYRIATVELSNSEEERLEASETESYINWRLAEKVKTDKEKFYDIPEDFLYSYPSEELMVTLVNGQSPEDKYCFYYDYESKKYWIHTLDPCQDYEDFYYNYSGKGSFTRLVELMGGSCSSEDMRAEWTIGEHRWEAELLVDESHYYAGFAVSMDGEELKLSNPKGRKNITVSGRAFTMEDVEKLLGAEITVDQVNRSCQISAAPEQ